MDTVSLLAPPLLGAFIGYLTNRIAIRMLFRPLKPWHVLGMRVPMTPGVIPSRRADLARNIGDMVGDRLLTGQDIGAALSEEPFQDHLRGIIDSRLAELLGRDLPSLPEVVPRRFRAYFRIGVKTLKYQLAEGLRAYMRGEAFERELRAAVKRQMALALRQEVNVLVPAARRETGHALLHQVLRDFLASEGFEAWLESRVRQGVVDLARRNQGLADILPRDLVDLLVEAVRERTPEILEALARVLSDPPVRARILRAGRRAVEDFIESMGPMGAMAAGFINIETVEERLGAYLDSKEEEINAWLADPEVRGRTARRLASQAREYLATPVNRLLGSLDDEELGALCGRGSRRLAAALRTEGVARGLAAMIRDNLEDGLDQGERPLGEVLEALLSSEGVEETGDRLADEVVAMLRSPRAGKLLGRMSADMVDTLLARPLGRLDRLVPPGIRRGMSDYLTTQANRMLLGEVPGLVDSLNIRRIVTDKVNGLDLLQLERLLLSIMEEQFRYINLFGALLGFVIGLLNLLIR